MMQQESNATLRPGLDVYYVSHGRHTYGATVKRILAHDRCDLTVYGSIDGMTPLGISTVYQAAYDSDGEQVHSWHKKSDVTGGDTP